MVDLMHETLFIHPISRLHKPRICWYNLNTIGLSGHDEFTFLASILNRSRQVRGRFFSLDVNTTVHNLTKIHGAPYNDNAYRW